MHHLQTPMAHLIQPLLLTNQLQKRASVDLRLLPTSQHPCWCHWLPPSMRQNRTSSGDSHSLHASVSKSYWSRRNPKHSPLKRLVMSINPKRRRRKRGFTIRSSYLLVGTVNQSRTGYTNCTVSESSTGVRYVQIMFTWEGK